MYMSFDEIIKKIRQETEKEIQALENQASQQIQEIRERTKEEAERRAKEIVEKAKEEAQEAKRQNAYAEEMERQEILNAAFEEAVARETKKAMKIVKEEIEKEMGRVIKEAILQFAKQIPKEDMIAKAPNKYAEIIKKEGVETQKAEGEGIELLSKDGKVRMEISPEKIAEKFNDIATSEVAKALRKKMVK